MPRMQSSVILVLAIVSGLAAFIISMSVIQPPKAKRAVGKGRLVVTAVKDIRIGTMIRKADVDLMLAPKALDPKVLFTNFKPVLGRLSRRLIRKGSAIRTIDLYEKGENLASLIRPGYRAMSIPVKMSANLAKLIYPGNRVDVLLTYKKSLQDYDTVILVKNAKVIDVTKDASMRGRGGEVRLSVTLAVTPEGAKTLAFAMEKGNLKITVRSLEEVEKDQREKFFTLKELFFGEDELSYRQLIPVSKGIETIRGLRKERKKFDTE